MKQPIDAFGDHFGGLEDGREAGKILHPLPEILLVRLCGVLAGAEGFEDIEDYGASKLDLRRQLLPFAHAVPSTIRYGGFSGPLIHRHFRMYLLPLCAICSPRRPRL
jgi:DDE family transposase